MIIECTNCHAKYQYDEDRFERKPSKKIKCAKCQGVFEIHNPAFAARPEPAVVGERTQTRRDGGTSRPRTLAGVPLPDEADAEVQPTTDKLETKPQLPVGKRLSLAIIDGPDAGNVMRIEKPRMTIGRSGADIVLNDTEASRQHAAVEIRDLVYLLYDLGSTNGTLVDGQKIQEATELQDKSEFVVGGTTLMLIVTDES